MVSNCHNNHHTLVNSGSGIFAMDGLTARRWLVRQSQLSSQDTTHDKFSPVRCWETFLQAISPDSYYIFRVTQRSKDNSCPDLLLKDWTSCDRWEERKRRRKTAQDRGHDTIQGSVTTTNNVHEEGASPHCQSQGFCFDSWQVVTTIAFNHFQSLVMTLNSKMTDNKVAQSILSDLDKMIHRQFLEFHLKSMPPKSVSLDTNRYVVLVNNVG